VVVGRAPYCPRHAGVVRALAHAPEEEREYPDVGNRAPSLCEWMAAALEESVQPLLAHYRAYRPDSSVAPESLTMAPTGTPRVRGWEHRWRLLDHTGPLATPTGTIPPTGRRVELQMAEVYLSLIHI